jgi:hypothetical protein
VSGGRRGVLPIRNFDPLPDAIREQASWGPPAQRSRVGFADPVTPGPAQIPFIDITDDERYVA